MNHVPQTLPTLEKLLARIASADKTNQREIRLSIQEGRDLALELALLSSKMAGNLASIEASLTNLKQQQEVIRVDVSGGKF